MMTPPPMPQMAPAMEAKKLTQRYKIDSIMIKTLPLPRLGHRRACSVSGTAPETANGSPSPSGRPEPRERSLSKFYHSRFDGGTQRLRACRTQKRPLPEAAAFSVLPPGPGGRLHL